MQVPEGLVVADQNRVRGHRVRGEEEVHEGEALPRCVEVRPESGIFFRHARVPGQDLHRRKEILGGNAQLDGLRLFLQPKPAFRLGDGGEGDGWLETRSRDTSAGPWASGR